MSASTGVDHSAAVTRDGKLFTWGKGNYGRLGHDNTDDQEMPKLVTALRSVKIIQVSCGTADDAHTLGWSRHTYD